MRRLLVLPIIPLLVACSAPTSSPPAPAKTESQPVAAQAAPNPTAQARPRAESKPQPEAASELGRRFVHALIAGDTGDANALLADSARSGLGAKTTEYARALGACAGTALDASTSQDQAMTNVLVRFAPPCGRAGDVAPLLPPGAIEPSQAESKLNGCLVAFRSATNGLRVANFACIPA